MSSDPDDSDVFDDDSCDSREDLVVCPECRAEVYAEAQRCPECGHWIMRDEHARMVWSPKQGPALKIVAAVLLVALVGFAAMAVAVAILSGW